MGEFLFTDVDPLGDGPVTAIDPRTIAADIMCGNARSITPSEVWAHIGQAYDVTEIDASLADEVAELIAKTGIDLIWPDGSKDTELDAARVEIERLRAELAAALAHDPMPGFPCGNPNCPCQAAAAAAIDAAERARTQETQP